jgi:CelD/BcsL family acetyltransferase involved in cellulose biosynthesis
LLQRSVRFGELGRANSIETDNRDNFYRYLADNTDPDNPFKLFALKTDTEVVAVAALMAHGDIANGVLISIGDASWHRLSPGIVLLVQTLRWARENKISNFSFGTGLQAYKQRFGAARQPVRRLLRPLSLKGQTFVLASRVKAMMHKGERAPDFA